MQKKSLDTILAFMAILLFSLVLALALQTEGAQQWRKSIAGLFFEDLDDIAPGPSEPEPINPMASWIMSEDYPMEALRNEWQGTSAIEWTVDRRGRVVDCRVARSSGHAILDEAACDAITARGRYKPARNAEGRRTEAQMSRRVVWRLPE